VIYSMLHCVEACCSCFNVTQYFAINFIAWQCVGVCCSVLQCVVLSCSDLQCVALCYSVLQCVSM